MKILHLLYESKGDYFGIGGVGTRAYKIYSRLRERHEITLLCKKYPGAEDGEIEGLRHVFVGKESKSLTVTLLSYAFRAVQFVKRYGDRYDIIIEEFSPAIPTFLHLFTDRPVVLQVQGYTGSFYFRKYNPLYALVLYILEYIRPRFYSNFIFVNEETVKKLLLKDLIAEKNRSAKIIPNGVSDKLLNKSPQDGDYILYLGRIDIYSKGLDILIDAYREFCRTFPEIRLAIAGDGREMEDFKRKIKGLPTGIRKNIELLGWVSGDKKINVVSNALFCVFPSRHETQGIVAVEAMAGGKPLIVSSIPEFGYTVKSKAGISFNSGDAISLAESMKDMMLSNERTEMGRRGREWVKQFTWDRIAVMYEEFLMDVLRRHEEGR